MAEGPGDLEPFGLWVRRRREAAGLTQEELAERSGLSVRTIGNLEREWSRKPYPRSVRLVACALGLAETAGDELIARCRTTGGVQSGFARQPDAGTNGLSPASPDGGQTPAGHAPVAVPRQLPTAVRHFAGRAAELKALDELLDEELGPGSATGAVGVAAISGSAGVGKSALAVYWAHRVSDRFPDGQLYVNLRGYGPSRAPVTSGEVIRGFLGALGVAPWQIPSDPDEQVGLYRSVLALRRVLIVADNARDEAQLRPLLPGSRTCLVMVTSRSRLTGLAVSDGVHVLTLGLLSEAEARELLAARLATARLAAEQEAAAELIRLCARLPLALAITAARASAHPGLRLAELARELRNAQQRLDALDTGDPATSARTVFSWSLGHLPTLTARLFGLLSHHPGPDITIPAAASLGGLPRSQARQALGELAEAHLITESAAGRFSMHDLLRAYAAEQARAAGERGSREAIGRLLGYYVHTSRAATLLLNPARETLSLAAPALPPGVSPDPLADHAQALAWYDAEHKNMLAAVEQAAGAVFDAEACLLAWSLADFLDRRGSWHDWVIAQQAALAAAVRLGDRGLQVRTERALGRAYTEVGALAEAEACFRRALELDRHPGNAGSRASTHLALARVLEYQGHFGQCLEHTRQALGLYRDAGDTAGQARALNGIGWFQVRLGHYQDAIGCCEQALSLYRHAEDRRGEATTCDSLGFAHYHLGQHARAIACYQQAMESFQEIGERPNLAETLTHLGDSYYALSHVDQAQSAWQQALAILDGLSPPDAAQARAKLKQLGQAGRMRMAARDYAATEARQRRSSSPAGADDRPEGAMTRADGTTSPQPALSRNPRATHLERCATLAVQTTAAPPPPGPAHPPAESTCPVTLAPAPQPAASQQTIRRRTSG
jgi:tetratricopeptide (TPR) repeat protein/DNA-binding XRE family transcriptional regulator